MKTTDSSLPYPPWMRAALWTTAVLNLFGGLLFLPTSSMVRAFLCLPSAAHPVYLWIIAEFILIVGVAYAYCAWTNRAAPVFIAVGAAGKLAFSVTLVSFWLLGELPVQVPLLGSADLVFGCMFATWLTQASTKP